LIRTIVFEREDGTQVLVTILANGAATMSERPDMVGTWGPPVRSKEDETRGG